MTEGEQTHKKQYKEWRENERARARMTERERDSFNQPQHVHDTCSLNTSDKLKTRITRKTRRGSSRRRLKKLPMEENGNNIA